MTSGVAVPFAEYKREADARYPEWHLRVDGRLGCQPKLFLALC